MRDNSSFKVKVEFNFKLRHIFINWLNDIDVTGIRTLAHLAPQWLIPSPKKNGVIQLPNGLKMWINPEKDDGVERSLYYTGSYESGTLGFIKSYLKKGECFVDVGANIGLMSLHASRIVGVDGSVYSFEPHPHTAKILRFNISLNTIENINAIEKGVGSENGNAQIFDRWDINRGGASLFSLNPDQEGFDIQVVTLDQVFENTKISMIKIDVEGFELEVLKGAKRILSSANPPIIIVECVKEKEHSDYSREALYSWLKNSNSQYKFYILKGSKSRKSELVEILHESELPIHDNLFCIP